MRKGSIIYVVLAVLAIAGYVSSSRAIAQSPGTLVGITMANSGQGTMAFAVDQSGAMYAGQGCFGNLRPFVRVGQLPTGAVPSCITTDVSAGSSLLIGCTNGEIYSASPFDYPSIAFTLCGSTSGAPTPAISRTWGGIKSRYR